MDIIKVFRKYMKRYHSHLTGEDWLADVRKVSVENLTDKSLQNILPPEVGEYITCWCFYYGNATNNLVFLFQDIRGESNIAITLLQNGIPINPIHFKSAVYEYRV